MLLSRIVDRAVDHDKQGDTMSTASDELREAIGAADQAFMDLFERSDAAGIAQLYTAEGQLLPGNSDFVTGVEAIEQFWRAVMEMGIKTARLETVELEECGNIAVEVGKYALAGEGGEVLDQGKYIVIWKNEAGTWKLHRDIWNTSLPAPD